jgi:indole-3-glycerol phosphate synthase
MFRFSILLVALLAMWSFQVSKSFRSVTMGPNIQIQFLSKLRMNAAYAGYLERMVERKKVLVDNMLRRHQDSDDKLMMRMGYMSSECNFNVTSSLKLPEDEIDDGLRRMSVLVDMKRSSPTIVDRRNVVEFSNAPKFAELLTLAGVDGFLINTDDMEYSGRPEELKMCSSQIRKTAETAKRDHLPACICKDLIIHPIQIAQALEDGAAGVLLIVAVVGSDLETLLDAATIMGTEAIVEVHTPNELEFALSKGATIFLVNCWDRMTGELFPDQAKGLASMLPMNSVAVAAGNIHTAEQAAELSFYGYDGIVLGRGLADLPDIKAFIDQVHDVRAPPKGMGMGMKGMPCG